MGLWCWSRSTHTQSSADNVHSCFLTALPNIILPLVVQLPVKIQFGTHCTKSARKKRSFTHLQPFQDMVPPSTMVFLQDIERILCNIICAGGQQWHGRPFSMHLKRIKVMVIKVSSKYLIYLRTAGAAKTFHSAVCGKKQHHKNHIWWSAGSFLYIFYYISPWNHLYLHQFCLVGSTTLQVYHRNILFCLFSDIFNIHTEIQT